MADGTLRVTLDVEPNAAQEAFRLFGSPGRGVAIAALKDGRAAIERPAEPIKTPKVRAPRVMGEDALAKWHELGPLCQAAIKWGQHDEFQKWLKVDNAAEAEARIKTICNVESRKQFDEEEDAGRRFKHFIVGPYQKHMQSRGLA